MLESGLMFGLVWQSNQPAHWWCRSISSCTLRRWGFLNTRCTFLVKLPLSMTRYRQCGTATFVNGNIVCLQPLQKVTVCEVKWLFPFLSLFIGRRSASCTSQFASTVATVVSSWCAISARSPTIPSVRDTRRRRRVRRFRVFCQRAFKIYVQWTIF